MPGAPDPYRDQTRGANRNHPRRYSLRRLSVQRRALLGRHNVEGATSKIYDKQSNVIDSGTYLNILDTTYFLDRELQHYVTPAINPSNSEMGYRQIIAISFSRPGSEHDIID